MTAAIGGSSSRQRSFGNASAAGTRTTGLPPAWAVLTAYVVDDTNGGINRVVNGGNLYCVKTGGTSASIGGPSGTGLDITDGTVHWSFLGVAPSNNTIAGSQILALVARGDQTLVGTIQPTDNDSGGTYTTVQNTVYNGFPTSFAGVFRRATASNAKTNFTASADFGATGGAGDGITVGWLELQGVAVGAPHAQSSVERATATSGTVTSASITTTVRCLVVSFWFGNGDTQATGTQDTATPNGGLALVPGATCPIAISSNGYMHCAVAARIANAGTFTENWSTTGQGAVLITVAYAAATPNEDEVPAASVTASIGWGNAQALSTMVAARSTQSIGDEIPGTAAASIIDDDSAASTLRPVDSWLVRPALVGIDEVPSQATVVDDGDAVAQVVAQAPWTVQLRAADSDLPSVLVDDDAAYPTPRHVVPWSPAAIPVEDEVTVLSVVADDDVVARVPIGDAAWAHSASGSDDDLPVQVAAIAADEDAVRTLVAELAWLRGPVVVDGDVSFEAAVVDDDFAPAPVAWAVPAGILPLGPSADVIPQAAVTADDDSAAPMLLWSVERPWIVQFDPDELPIEGPPGAMVEQDPVVQHPTWPLSWLAWVPILPEELAHLFIPEDLYDGPIGSTDIYDGAIPDTSIYDGLVLPPEVYS